ncbi:MULTISPECIES: hypothetical protein [Paraburkholderia]|uniref:Apea-like HEPN domain-containing protein n=1 Tax=Paraburkholderia podalyriae TaxID=1938811 RepID=A0ABR7Q1W5_9BURK|nr:hypothetical protein [Paraburkholderia podalyriae]MBC8752546.1 hypothetical protein [Paraburkholderia podalyriae]
MHWRNRPFADGNDEERTAISNFTLLWSVMEGRVLDRKANPTSLLAAVKALAQRGPLRLSSFEASLTYFRDRYFQGGEFTYHFENLLFRKPDCRPLVEGVLSGSDDDLEHVVGALLLITYRLRNNLFHGEKWKYGIREQQENFRHASDILMRIIELHPA